MNTTNDFTPCPPAATPGKGFRIDGALVRFWATKRDAVTAAKSIGWPADCVTPVHTRFCAGFALHDPRGFLSREGFGRLRKDRNRG